MRKADWYSKHALLLGYLGRSQLWCIGLLLAVQSVLLIFYIKYICINYYVFVCFSIYFLLFIRLFIHSVMSLIQLYIHPVVHSYIHTLIHSCFCSLLEHPVPIMKTILLPYNLMAPLYIILKRAMARSKCTGEMKNAMKG